MSLSDPFVDGVEVTPADTNLRRGIADGLFVTVDGNLKITTLGGSVLGPFPVTAGMIIPFRVAQVNTGTTATVIAGFH